MTAEPTLRDVLTAVVHVDGRVEQLNGQVEQLNGRVEQLDGRVEQLHGRVEQLDGQVGQLRDEQASSRRAVLDEIAGLRHYVQGLDRDIAAVINRVLGEE